MTRKKAMEAACRLLLFVGLCKIIVGLFVAMAGTLVVALSLLTDTPN